MILINSGQDLGRLDHRLECLYVFLIQNTVEQDGIGFVNVNVSLIEFGDCLANLLTEWDVSR